MSITSFGLAPFSVLVSKKQIFIDLYAAELMSVLGGFSFNA